MVNYCMFKSYELDLSIVESHDLDQLHSYVVLLNYIYGICIKPDHGAEVTIQSSDAKKPG